MMQRVWAIAGLVGYAVAVANVDICASSGANSTCTVAPVYRQAASAANSEYDNVLLVTSFRLTQSRTNLESLESLEDVAVGDANESLEIFEDDESLMAEDGIALVDVQGGRRRRRRFIGGRRRRRIGKVISGAARTVGNGVVDGANTVANGVEDAATFVGNGVVKGAKTVGRTAVKVGRVTVTAAKDLGSEIKHVATGIGRSAKKAADEGKKLANKVGREIKSKADALGDGLEKLGSVAVGFAKDAWEGIKDFFSCFSPQKLLCPLLLPGCDCDAGSSIAIDFEAVSLKAKCVAPTGDFGKSFGLSSSADASFGAGDASSSGKAKLPGVEKEGAKKGKVKDRAETASEQARSGLRDKLAKAPEGSCERDLSLALDGEVEMEPVIELEVSATGDATVKVSATASVSLDLLIEAEGSCSFSAERRFPKVPKTKVACAGYFCIALMLQAVAQIDINGALTGSVNAGVAADFGIRTEIIIDLASGSASATSSATEFNHQEGMSFAAAMNGAITVGLGPHLVVWPMPGVPVDIFPTINAQVKALGELEWMSEGSLGLIQTCAGASLNVFGNSDIGALGLPDALQAGLSTDWLQEAVEQAILEGATKMLEIVMGPLKCLPGGGAVEGAVMKAAESAASALAGAIPSLDVSLPSMLSETISSDEIFCRQLIEIGSVCEGSVGCD